MGPRGQMPVHSGGAGGVSTEHLYKSLGDGSAGTQQRSRAPQRSIGGMQSGKWARPPLPQWKKARSCPTCTIGEILRQAQLRCEAQTMH